MSSSELNSSKLAPKPSLRSTSLKGAFSCRTPDVVLTDSLNTKQKCLYFQGFVGDKGGPFVSFPATETSVAKLMTVDAANTQYIFAIDTPNGEGMMALETNDQFYYEFTMFGPRFVYYAKRGGTWIKAGCLDYGGNIHSWPSCYSQTDSLNFDGALFVGDTSSYTGYDINWFCINFSGNPNSAGSESWKQGTQVWKDCQGDWASFWPGNRNFCFP